ncbi:MAG: DUF4258 domain-containing protein [Nitrospirota bacterium]
MIIEEKEQFIRQKAKEHIPEINEKISWSLHAVKKLRIERLRKKEVENSLKECIIIEDYVMEDRPLPGCLALGFIGSIPVHSVIAIDMDFDRIFVVTVYRPSLERWENDWKTRKT